ncbi:hypothetical protein GCM10011499_10710 [Pelagibacterium lentulum]|uniref:Uncharacterized protein n=1 Tax=Pelagibacterium lentulum TaxID=2029865 RepID=A0A916R9A4_9HYPH|nr:hypothetical protein GCM10011499_10710 [Pelagibacterium lentulum]
MFGLREYKRRTAYWVPQNCPVIASLLNPAAIRRWQSALKEENSCGKSTCTWDSCENKYSTLINQIQSGNGYEDLE